MQATTMQAYDRPASETLCLSDTAGEYPPPAWAVFDPEWYRRRYPDAPSVQDDDLLQWHLAMGQTLAHSPNRWFDEEWQRYAWPGMAELIGNGVYASAFDAWCRDVRILRPPHWLFNPTDYRRRYQTLTDAGLTEYGFVNLYHHYLGFGARERRIGHFLFDPEIYLAGLGAGAAEDAAPMPFEHYLRGLETGAPERKTSLLFDPDWYADRYPDAAGDVASGRYRSLLQHYLCNEQPTEFDPSRWFSEAHYLREDPGLAAAIGPAAFRNGFAHFLAFGLEEGRSPHPDLDLRWYAGLAEVQADIAAGWAGDPFLHCIKAGGPDRPGGYPSLSPAPPRTEAQTVIVAPDQAIALHAIRANAIWPLFGRHKLDFTCLGAPAISVIMAIRRLSAATITSLSSLRSGYRGDIELILIDSAPESSGLNIETLVAGATILRFGTDLNDTAAREAGLVCSTPGAVLLLSDGVEMAPGAIDNALARLLGDTSIGAVGARLVAPDGTLHEAGGIIWGNGELQAYARGASPLAAEANFVRDTDFCSTRFLLARRDVLASLPEQAPGLAGTSHEAAALCTRIRLAGFRIVYEPDALVFLTVNRSDEEPGPRDEEPGAGDQELEPREQAHPRDPEPWPHEPGPRHQELDDDDHASDGQAAFVLAFDEYLAGQPEFDPAAVIQARSPQGNARHGSLPLVNSSKGNSPGGKKPRVLFVEDAIPLRRIGSGFVRSNDILRAMAGWGLPITLYPMNGNHFALAAVSAAIPDTVEVMHELTAADFADFLAARQGCYDLIWVARTHNLELIAGVLGGPHEAGAAQEESPEITPPPPASWFDLSELPLAFTQFESFPAIREPPPPEAGTPRVVVDTEAVISVRRAQQAALEGRPFDLHEALRQEFRHLDPAMDVVAVNEADAAIIRAHHRGRVSVLGHTVTASPTAQSFEERTGILFVGAIHAQDHPNYEGLAWFIDEVLPIVERTLRWQTRLTVAGYVAPGVSLDRLEGNRRVTLRGPVDDLRPLYDAHRVFVAPARFAAGIPYKVHEAGAFGVPVVGTSVLAQQLGWRDGEEMGAAEISDAAGFAARVVALHMDIGLWTRMREAALRRIRAELGVEAFVARVGELTGVREARPGS